MQYWKSHSLAYVLSAEVKLFKPMQMFWQTSFPRSDSIENCLSWLLDFVLKFDSFSCAALQLSLWIIDIWAWNTILSHLLWSCSSECCKNDRPNLCLYSAWSHFMSSVTGHPGAPSLMEAKGLSLAQNILVTSVSSFTAPGLIRF